MESNIRRNDTAEPKSDSGVIDSERSCIECGLEDREEDSMYCWKCGEIIFGKNY